MPNNRITLSSVAEADKHSELALDKVVRLCHINARDRQIYKKPPTLKVLQVVYFCEERVDRHSGNVLTIFNKLAIFNEFAINPKVKLYGKSLC